MQTERRNDGAFLPPELAAPPVDQPARHHREGEDHQPPQQQDRPVPVRVQHLEIVPVSPVSLSRALRQPDSCRRGGKRRQHLRQGRVVVEIKAAGGERVQARGEVRVSSKVGE